MVRARIGHNAYAQTTIRSSILANEPHTSQAEDGQARGNRGDTNCRAGVPSPNRLREYYRHQATQHLACAHRSLITSDRGVFALTTTEQVTLAVQPEADELPTANHDRTEVLERDRRAERPATLDAGRARRLTASLGDGTVRCNQDPPFQGQLPVRRVWKF